MLVLIVTVVVLVVALVALSLGAGGYVAWVAAGATIGAMARLRRWS